MALLCGSVPAEYFDDTRALATLMELLAEMNDNNRRH